MAVAVISEFNPFHNGHRFLIEKAKRLTGEDVLAVMSGSFTQRGEVAVTDKFERAKIALENGVDLVLELPAVYAVSNAQRFARGGVAIARSFACVNYLAFGCETDDIDLLRKAAFAVGNENVKKFIREKMSRGGYYPQAVEQAVREVCGDATAGVLTSPNNILAVEYLRALGDSNIKPLPIKRTGAGHDSDTSQGHIASASYIRRLLRSGKPADSFLPSVPKEITHTGNLERAILFQLRVMTADDFRRLPDVSEGLENRIVEAVKRSGSVEEIIGKVKTKRYTHARLRRIIACAFLGITEELQGENASYARVLGFDSHGVQMLRSCRFDVVTSVPKAMKRGGVNARFLEKDVLASDLAALAFDRIRPCSSDCLTKMMKVISAN